MPLFTTLTKENVHWALTQNLDIAYRELGLKVPTGGSVVMRGDLVADSSTRRLINPSNKGARSAYSINTLEGFDGDANLNSQVLSAPSLEDLWQSYVDGSISQATLRSNYEATLAPLRQVNMTQLSHGAVNTGLAGGTWSMPGVTVVEAAPVEPITVLGEVFESPYKMWDIQTFGVPTLNYVNTIPSQSTFTVVAWVRLKKIAPNLKNAFQGLFSLQHSASTTIWANHLYFGGIHAVNFSDGAGKYKAEAFYPRLGLKSQYPELLPEVQRHANGRIPKDPLVLPNPPSDVLSPSYMIAIRYNTSNNVNITINNRVMPVKKLATSTAGNPAAPSFTIDASGLFFGEGLQIGHVSVYHSVLSDTDLRLHYLLRI